jgi:hypothetical protein
MEKIEISVGFKNHHYTVISVDNQKIDNRKGKYWIVECQCGEKYSRSNSTDTIQAHHLDGWHWRKEKRYDENNGVTLCVGKMSGCHYEFHSKYGSGNNTKEQFAKFLLNCYHKNLQDIVERDGIQS